MPCVTGLYRVELGSLHSHWCFFILFIYFIHLFIYRGLVYALVKFAKQYKFNVAAKLEMTLSGDTQ